MSTPHTKKDTPAARAVDALGLIDVAHACRLTTDAVRKWLGSKGGYVPAQHQGAVLQLARARNADLSAEDLIAFRETAPKGAAA